MTIIIPKGCTEFEQINVFTDNLFETKGLLSNLTVEFEDPNEARSLSLELTDGNDGRLIGTSTIEAS